MATGLTFGANAFAWAVLFTASVAIGAEAGQKLEGQVRVYGTVAESRVVLTAPGEIKGPRLCSGDTAKRMVALESMTVAVTGEWKSGEGKAKCFDPVGLKILKTSLGHDAVVGKLDKNADGSFQVTGDDGKPLVLGDVPDGLRKLSGKTVILDVKPLASPTTKTPGYKTISYMEMP